jgi:hypothetical protein
MQTIQFDGWAFSHNYIINALILILKFGQLLSMK